MVYQDHWELVGISDTQYYPIESSIHDVVLPITIPMNKMALGVPFADSFRDIFWQLQPSLENCQFLVAYL
ncbi:hypothetical protein Csa_016898 [Cucumis sativus]|nr:hypothetical protein Csa_016898 [Cucumis sativus]